MRALVVALLAMLAACGTGDSLAGREFVVVGSDGIELAPGSAPRFTYSDGLLRVTGGCNTLSGTYRLEGDRLVVEEMSQTEMACDEPLMALDAAISALLLASPTWSLDGDSLRLTDGLRSLRMVDREIAEPDRDVDGTTWRVDTVIDAGAASHGWGGAEATIRIVDGRMEVAAGCNRGSATVEVGEGVLTVGPLGLTRMVCDDEAMRLERAVVDVLVGEVEYRVEGSRLRLSRGDRGLQLVATD